MTVGISFKSNPMNLKKIIIPISFLTMTVLPNFAENMKLPAPDHSCATTLDAALGMRRSVRDFDSSKTISDGMLSNLLWAAAGVNRPDGRRTNPTALNKQEIEIYVFTADGVSRYNCGDHSLEKVADGDYRGLVAGSKSFSQDFVLDAPVSLVLVADLERFDGGASERTLMMGMADAGIVSQNINLFCAANGLATVPRATMDADGIKALLGLGAAQVPALNNPVGYEKQTK